LEPDPRGEATSYTPVRSRKKRDRPLKRLIPFLILAGVGVLIARQEIPAVNDWWERTFSAEEWEIKDTCKQAVLEESSNRQYVRVLKGGEVHVTRDGPYIDGLKIVVLGEAGREEVMDYTCYLDNEGHLFKLTRNLKTE
jgi:hypothetical protein